ncbi:hypothetical protein GH714_003193 [Hevea brasiliensis]|uniref:Uncharacterized protein n=1 Tax=Hevea brasiliensis TaxID=3981 RepID=A0A6A6MAP3_HEVBR|nr:hypothetical protein GH714_003193 [Hevea brasiliensis]
MQPLPQSINPRYKPSDKLHGKVALVTGGDSGIGRVCIRGCTVAFTYVKGIEDKDDTLQMLGKVKANDANYPIAIAADIRFEENCKRVVDQVVNEFGQIDSLINNAAEEHYTESIEEITEAVLKTLFRTNIFSLFFFTSEGAILSFTRSLALQLIKQGIRVNAVAPFPTCTPQQPASLPADMVAHLGCEAPMGRAGQPYEISPAFVFLASREGSCGSSSCLNTTVKLGVTGSNGQGMTSL